MSVSEISNQLILNEIQKGNNELKLALQALEVKLTLKIEEINHRLIQAEKENEDLKKRVEILERNQKKNNIVIFGFEREERYITVDCMIKFMKNFLKIELAESDFNNIYPLGQTYNSPVKVEFTSYFKKIAVLKNAKNLKGTTIRIAQDLTEQQRIESKILRKHLYAAKENKENTCYIKNNRLYVNGRIFTPSELENPEEDSSFKVPTKPQSDPGIGTPTIETNKCPEQTTEEPTAAQLPATENKTSSTQETTSAGILTNQVTPKTGAIKKINKEVIRDKPITRQNYYKSYY